jgi:hypothetical protein
MSPLTLAAAKSMNMVALNFTKSKTVQPQNYRFWTYQNASKKEANTRHKHNLPMPNPNTFVYQKRAY